jgi:Undecaprenyl-phosphate glucose phosphotransferase
MLKKHAQFFKSLFILSDILVLSIAWMLSYFLRCYTAFINHGLGTPSFQLYVEFLVPLWVIWSLVTNRLALYHPRRMDHFFKELFDIVKSLTLTLFILIACIYLFKKFEFSRLAFFYFWIMGLLFLMASRFTMRKALNALRARGYNLRHALIAGTGGLGRQILQKIEIAPELGIKILGFLTSKREEIGKKIGDIPIIGTYEEIDKILKNHKIDIAFLALPIDEYKYVSRVIKKLQGYLVDIKVVPGVYELITLRGGVDELDGLPMVSLQNSPLYGWNKVFKGSFDLIVSALILVVVSPIMVVISILIKTTSKGKILYRQERIGMDGRPFQMLKFRTMNMDAEKETGPIWAKANDPRRTKIGAFLRKTSLDELPQLFNVLKGDMSLVGPRPERPHFIGEFKNQVPLYMLRHKIKAGMTGWAQVNGWRGNTSLEKRIEYDLYYIQHWTIGFDLRILRMTLWRGFFSKSAC